MNESLFGISLREPPANVPAEQALLGAILANNLALDRVSNFLLPEHFVDPIHGKIYREINNLVQANKLADCITLKNVFEHSGTLEEVGGLPYLAQLLTAMVGLINATEYGKVVYDCWVRRQLIDAGEVLVNNSFVPPKETPSGMEVLEDHENKIQKIVQGTGARVITVSAEDAAMAAIKVAKSAMKRGDALAGITSGYSSLDRFMFGLQPEQLILIGARPSMGKTALALGIAARAAAAGAKVLYWCGEMSAPQLGARLVAAHTGLSTTSVFSGHSWSAPEDTESRPQPLGLQEWIKMERSAKEIGKLNLKFDTLPGINAITLRARARKLQRTSGIDLIVVDYLQLMRASREAQSKGLYAAMTEVSRDLMELKNELGIPIIAMAQLNRANESREDKAPQLSDLRDSGSLEQDCNVCLMIHRSHYYLSRFPAIKRFNESEYDFAERCSILEHEKMTSAGKATIIIAKNRNGPTGNVELQFDDTTTWFRDRLEAPHSNAW